MASSIVDYDREDIVFECYDTFQGTPPEGDAGYHQKLIREQDLDLEALFRKHVNEHGLSTVVRAWRGESVRSAELHRHRSLDLVFIDGDHRREMVRKDVQAWLPKIRYGGVIAGHDATAENVIAGVRDAGIEPIIEGEIWHWRNRLPVHVPQPIGALTVGPLAHGIGAWNSSGWFGEPMARACRDILGLYFVDSPSGISISECSGDASIVICPCDNHDKWIPGDVFRRGATDDRVFPAFPHSNWFCNAPGTPGLSFGTYFAPRTDLTVGFCGAPRPALRKKSLELLAADLSINTNFILRDGFLGGSVERNTARAEFLDNMSSNTYQACVRGVGNYCYRLYETLSAGRIPILVGDRPIPWDVQVNYVPAKTPEQIIPALREFHSYYDAAGLEKLQKQNRKLWLDYLSPYGWWREWARQR